MSELQSYYALHSEKCSLLVDCRDHVAAILYWGCKLSGNTSPEMIATLATRQEAQARAEIEAPISLSPESGAGFLGNPGIQAHREGRQWGVYSQLSSVEIEENNQLVITSQCDAAEVRIVHRLKIDEKSDVLIASTELTNIGSTILSLEYCAAPTIPLPLDLNRILGFEGRWSHEFQLRCMDRFAGSYLRENRSGRTSHDSFPAIVVHETHTNESHGAALGLHLGWSGNHRLRVDELSDGRAYAQFGELFFPGEMTLAPQASYRSPELYGAYTECGLNGISHCFHRYVRSELTAERMRNKTKPVHFNTWEAMYFDLSMERLCKLADAAADVGVERFVLDDGWFRKRKSDTAGLGDWYVDEDTFPDGLKPLTDYVNAGGMEFGLWVEPEMVNEDSDLYRSHPDWVLNAAPAPLLRARNQLVLDLTRPEVTDYLFERIDALLTEYPITYLKWDMNRDLSQPGNASGTAVTHYQTLALYALLRRVRGAHPTVEIESCSSGGGRADFGVLAHTDRIWTSDSNDAIDRLRIQKGFSLYFPPELMGAHVGPKTCHITGRRTSLATRAGVAMVGDMGIEANLLDMSDGERSELKAAVALHKRFRQLIFSGDLRRLDTPAYETAHGFVSGDQKEALFLYALVGTLPHSAPGRLHFRGLSRETLYDVRVVWPEEPHSYSASILDVIESGAISGDALMSAGLQLPIMKPESLLIFHLAQAS